MQTTLELRGSSEGAFCDHITPFGLMGEFSKHGLPKKFQLPRVLQGPSQHGPTDQVEHLADGAQLKLPSPTVDRISKGPWNIDDSLQGRSEKKKRPLWSYPANSVTRCLKTPRYYFKLN